MKIVCAIDGSRYSEWALDWLRHLASPNDSSLLLVHAVDLAQFKTLSRLDRKARATLVKVLDFSLEGAARLLEGAELKAARTWGRVRARLLRGRAAEAIVRSAEREQADLLVIGSRGVTEFQPMLLGSTSRKVLMQAPCPVLVVKRSARAQESGPRNGRFHRVVGGRFMAERVTQGDSSGYNGGRCDPSPPAGKPPHSRTGRDGERSD